MCLVCQTPHADVLLACTTKSIFCICCHRQKPLRNKYKASQHALGYMLSQTTCDCFLAMQPGYLHEQLPKEAPQQGETWEAIMEDVNKCIVPGTSLTASLLPLQAHCAWICLGMCSRVHCEKLCPATLINQFCFRLQAAVLQGLCAGQLRIVRYPLPCCCLTHVLVPMAKVPICMSSQLSLSLLCSLYAGLTHWQSSNFFAYFPCNSSFPAMLGEMLCAGFATQNFSWIGSPAATELETVSSTCCRLCTLHTVVLITRQLALPKRSLALQHVNVDLHAAWY